MPPLDQMDAESLRALRERLTAEHEALKARGLTLNIARGKPSKEQLDLSNAMLSLPEASDTLMQSGEDARNYGGDPQGLPELRAIFAPFLGAPVEQVIAGGNSSLAMMHDVIVWALLKGVPGGNAPWAKSGDIAFLCPAPGYELHHRMCEDFGIRLLPVPVTPEGPDMDVVENLVRDPAVKGMWCVPTYANPTGEVWSDAVVDRLAAMATGAPDFRLFWDDAYVVHHLGDSRKAAKPILAACAAAGHPDRALAFASTSKITFAGAGVGFLAASPANVAWYMDRARRRGPGPDKLNQLRHVHFLRDADGVRQHMDKHRELLAPKFAAILDALESRLAGTGVASWSRPEGGYFISIETVPGAAKRAVALAAEAGVSLTVAGSTWPHGLDPKDSNIRIAPSFASLEEVRDAGRIIALSILLAATGTD
ncbi:aminotransferase class I/II-fold pyridoxal phosphate-dependent enzyme [Rhizobium pusense]|uniref:aminotransferase class I/II-fold pyridoxal phosphate-dependent enzyme n=1 Tax=Agrobacterium pusense TaxID=648995 RepID=UPI001FCDC16A|nr:aminotransferase class I/II-fold pyridoxal phosphate-dependent enzyme [Agrobacterium pusense]MCJ2876638.1 aminotransferase class I/II-fold pyridoxal phosphate-dependent enzyme [Agrobacterium pusense]